MGLRAVRWCFSLSAILGIAYLDYVTGKNLAVWGLYLIPIGLASWMGGLRAGFLLSVVSCVLMFIDGIYGGTMFSGNGIFPAGDSSIGFIALLIGVLAGVIPVPQANA